MDHPETVLQEESIKKPCRKFHFEGFCPFGGSCTYSHYTTEDLDAIQQKLFFEKSNKVEPTVETWLIKYYNELNQRKLRSQQLQWSCQLPPELYTRMPFLPPSMVPFRLQTFMDADLEMWGE
ncbi:hypothetical protein RUM44_007346 [Polyplax serrata]|uniref:C3H1-type domain-containing protein n=1 Tax=Polyplax serrata TaxID=468196 RepID=A0ABR1B0E1_POLSC